MSKSHIRYKDKVAYRERKKIHALIAKALKIEERRHKRVLSTYYEENN